MQSNIELEIALGALQIAVTGFSIILGMIGYYLIHKQGIIGVLLPDAERRKVEMAEGMMVATLTFTGAVFASSGGLAISLIVRRDIPISWVFAPYYLMVPAVMLGLLGPWAVMYDDSQKGYFAGMAALVVLALLSWVRNGWVFIVLLIALVIVVVWSTLSYYSATIDDIRNIQDGMWEWKAELRMSEHEREQKWIRERLQFAVVCGEALDEKIAEKRAEELARIVVEEYSGQR